MAVADSSLDVKYKQYVTLYSRKPSINQFQIFANIKYIDAKKYISSLPATTTTINIKSHNHNHDETKNSTDKVLTNTLEAMTINIQPSDTDYKFSSDEYKNGYPVTSAPKLDPIARILLMGVYDDGNIFSTFRGMRYIIKAIWEYTLQFNKYAWKPFIKTNAICLKEMLWRCDFPEPKDININMMPFIMSKDFGKTQLPKYLKVYYNQFIKHCLYLDESQLDKICFLTIQESFVDKNKTQRRPGLHVEHPGCIYVDDDDNNEWMKGDGRNAPKWIPGPWGDLSGHHELMPIDGIYMASSVDKSCVAWDCKIVKGITGREIIGHLGDIQHLKTRLSNGKKQILDGNSIYWLTDRTPHESLPMKERGYRQFFRLVTHNVSVWHQANSTPNPNGLVPDPNITRIIKRNKFDT